MAPRISYRLMNPADRRQVFALVERGFEEFVRRDCTREGVEEFHRAARSLIFDPCDMESPGSGRRRNAGKSREVASILVPASRDAGGGSTCPADHRIMVAAYGRQIVGMIDLRDGRHISLFFVDREHQNKGIGRALLHRVVKHALQRPLEAAELDVNSSVHAAPIYERLGFRREEPARSSNGIRFVKMIKTAGA